MKKIIVFLILLTGISLAQSNGMIVGKGAIWSDSLYYGTPGDSSRIFDVNLVYEWITIATEGNANSPVDSLTITPGFVQYTESGAIADTVWGSSALFRDNTWGAVNRVVNTSAGASFLMINPTPQLIKVTIANDRATLTTRKLTYQLIGMWK